MYLTLNFAVNLKLLFKKLYCFTLGNIHVSMLGPGALERPRGIGWRGRWEGGSGWGIHVNPPLIMSMNDKNHYNIVK